MKSEGHTFCALSLEKRGGTYSFPRGSGVKCLN